MKKRSVAFLVGIFAFWLGCGNSIAAQEPRYTGLGRKMFSLPLDLDPASSKFGRIFFVDRDTRSERTNSWNQDYSTYDQHEGTDFAVPKGTLVLAAASGTVVFTKASDRDDDETEALGASFGNQVVIDHGDQVRVLYAHLQYDSVLVRAGDTVERGDPIARVASSGTSTGYHLHFQVHLYNSQSEKSGTSINGGQVIDPYSLDQEKSWWINQNAYISTNRVVPEGAHDYREEFSALQVVSVNSSVNLRLGPGGADSGLDAEESELLLLIDGPLLAPNPGNPSEMLKWWKILRPRSPGTDYWVAENFLSRAGPEVLSVIFQPEENIQAGEEIDLALVLDRKITSPHWLHVFLHDNRNPRVLLTPDPILMQGPLTAVIRGLEIPAELSSGSYSLSFWLHQDDGDGEYSRPADIFWGNSGLRDSLAINGRIPQGQGGGELPPAGALKFEDIDVRDSPSGDGNRIFNPGETLCVTAEIKNTGDVRLRDVSVYLRSEDEYLDAVSDRVDLGTLDVGESVEITGLELRVGSLDGEEVLGKIRLKVVSDEGRWENFKSIRLTSNTIKPPLPAIAMGRSFFSNKFVVPGDLLTIRQQVRASGASSVIVVPKLIRMSDGFTLRLADEVLKLTEGPNTYEIEMNIPDAFDPVLHGVVLDFYSDLDGDGRFNSAVDGYINSVRKWPAICGVRCRVSKVSPPRNAQLSFPRGFGWTTEGECDFFKVGFRQAGAEPENILWGPPTASSNVSISASGWASIRSRLGGGNDFQWVVASTNEEGEGRQIISPWINFSFADVSGPSFVGWQNFWDSRGVSEIGKLDDPDGDGLSNLEEFAFNSNPLESSQTPLSVVVCKVAGEEYFCLQFHRWKRAIDVSYIVEGSDELGGEWRDIGNELLFLRPPQPNGDGTRQLIQLRLRHPISETQARYFRIRISD